MLPTMIVSYQHIMIKVPTIWAKLPTYPAILDLLLFLKYMFLYKLLKLSNPQIIAFGWKWSQLKKVPTLSVSYQHIVIKVPTNWAKLPTYLGILNLLTSWNPHFWRNYYSFKTHKQQLLVELKTNSNSYQYWQSVTNILWSRYQQFGPSYQHIQEH